MSEQRQATHAAVPIQILEATLAILQTELPMAKVRQIVQALEACPTLTVPKDAKPGDSVTPEGENGAAGGQG